MYRVIDGVAVNPVHSGSKHESHYLEPELQARLYREKDGAAFVPGAPDPGKTGGSPVQIQVAGIDVSARERPNDNVNVQDWINSSEDHRRQSQTMDRSESSFSYRSDTDTEDRLEVEKEGTPAKDADSSIAPQPTPISPLKIRTTPMPRTLKEPEQALATPQALSVPVQDDLRPNLTQSVPPSTTPQAPGRWPLLQKDTGIDWNEILKIEQKKGQELIERFSTLTTPPISPSAEIQTTDRVESSPDSRPQAKRRKLIRGERVSGRQQAAAQYPAILPARRPGPERSEYEDEFTAPSARYVATPEVHEAEDSVPAVTPQLAPTVAQTVQPSEAEIPAVLNPRTFQPISQSTSTYMNPSEREERVGSMKPSGGFDVESQQFLVQEHTQAPEQPSRWQDAMEKRENVWGPTSENDDAFRDPTRFARRPTQTYHRDQVGGALNMIGQEMRVEYRDNPGARPSGSGDIRVQMETGKKQSKDHRVRLPLSESRDAFNESVIGNVGR